MQYTCTRVIIYTDKGKADNPQTAERVFKMKKFETLTEYEILNATYSYYLLKWGKELDFLEKNSDDIIAKSRSTELLKILDELAVEMVKLKNQ